MAGDLRLAVDRELRDRERVVFDVGVIGQDIASGGGVFRGGTRVIHADWRVIDRGDCQRERRGRGQAAIGERVGRDREATIEVGNRREDVGTISVDAEVTLTGDGRRRASAVISARDGELRDRQGVVLDVGIIGEDVTHHVGVFGTRVGVGDADGGVVDRGDGEGELGRAGEGTIGDRVGRDGDGTVPVKDWREGVGTVGVDGEGTLTGDRDRLAGDLRLAVDRELRDRERVVFDVGVIGQDIASGGGVFRGGTRVIHADWRVIDRGDCQRERRGRGQAAIGERVADTRDRAIEVRVRREDVGAVGVNRHRTLTGDGRRCASRVSRTRDGEFGDAEQVGVDVQVIGEQIASDVRVFGARGVVRDTDWSVVDRVNGQRELGGTRQRTIGDAVSDGRHRAVGVSFRREGPGTIAVDGDGTLARDDRGGTSGVLRRVAEDEEGRNGRRGAIDIDIIRQHVAGADDIFGDGGGVVDTARRVVDGRHGQRDRAGRSSRTIGGRVSDDWDAAVPVGHRSEGV